MDRGIDLDESARREEGAASSALVWRDRQGAHVRRAADACRTVVFCDSVESCRKAENYLKRADRANGRWLVRRRYGG